MITRKGWDRRGADCSVGSGEVSEDHLVDLVYGCLLGEACWQEFLDRLARALPGGMSTLFYHEASTGAGSWQFNHGLPPEAVGKYSDHYSKLNPWMAKASVRRVGVGVVAEQMYPREKFVRSEFYNDYFRGFGGESAVGITIVRDEGRSFLLSTMTSRADPDLNMAAARQLTRLAPHLRRVFKYFQTDIRHQPTELGCSLLNAINVGVAVIGDGSMLRSISESGQRIIQTTGCARTSVWGKFRLGSEEANAALDRLLDRSYEGPREATFAVGLVKLTLILTQKDPYLAYFAGPTIAVLMEEMAREAPFDAAHLVATFSLTAAETRALNGIVSGKSVDEIAATAKLSRETIRSQLKSLYSKTGASGQADIIRLARSSVLRGTA